MSSKIQKRIEGVDAIIDSLKDEPDMSEISYTAASVVSKRHGSKDGKVMQLLTLTHRHGDGG